jgi:hypothetical protein
MGTEINNKDRHPLDCLTDWMEHLENASLDELRQIRQALGHDVEASERQFLAMLREKLPHLKSAEQKQDVPQIIEVPISGLFAEGKARGMTNFQLADAVDLSITLIAQLDRRLIDFRTIPGQVIQDLARVLQRGAEIVSQYLQGPPLIPSHAEFKAEQTPRVKPVEDFFDAVRQDRSISESRRQRLLDMKQGN